MADDAADTPQENNEAAQPAPTSFAEVMKLVQEGKQDELPGIKKIDSKLSDDSETLLKDAQTEKKSMAKPWEKNDGDGAEAESAPKTLFDKLNSQRAAKEAEKKAEVEATTVKAEAATEEPKDTVSTETKARSFLSNPAVQSMLPQSKAAFLQQKLGMDESHANRLVAEYATAAGASDTSVRKGGAVEQKEAGVEDGSDTDSRVKRAVTFLQNPRLAVLTLEQKILFLAQKQNMNREEIALAIAQLQPSEDEVQESLAKAKAEAEAKAEAGAGATTEGALMTQPCFPVVFFMKSATI
jgi:hypothetical protein